MQNWNALLTQHNGLRLRNCSNCGQYKHMVRVVDKDNDYYSWRRQVCFSCQPEYNGEISDNRTWRRNKYVNPKP